MERKARPNWQDDAKRRVAELLGIYGRDISQLAEIRAKAVSELAALRADLTKMIASIDADIRRLEGTKTAERVRTRVVSAGAKEPLLTPQSVFTLPLLECLVEAGGSLGVSEVLRKIGEKFGRKLTSIDWQRTKSGQIKWQNRVQWLRLRLVHEGYLTNDSPRGIWEITESGKRLYQESKSKAESQGRGEEYKSLEQTL